VCGGILRGVHGRLPGVVRAWRVESGESSAAADWGSSQIADESGIQDWEAETAPRAYVYMPILVRMAAHDDSQGRGSEGQLGHAGALDLMERAPFARAPKRGARHSLAIWSIVCHQRHPVIWDASQNNGWKGAILI
jgi:hypothetical protein